MSSLLVKSQYNMDPEKGFTYSLPVASLYFRCPVSSPPPFPLLFTYSPLYPPPFLLPKIKSRYFLSNYSFRTKAPTTFFVTGHRVLTWSIISVGHYGWCFFLGNKQQQAQGMVSLHFRQQNQQPWLHNLCVTFFTLNGYGLNLVFKLI